MKIRHIAPLILSLFWATASYGQNLSFSRPGDAVKYRQGLFTVLGAHTQKMGAMAKGDVPFDKQAAEQQAVLIELLSKQLNSAFPPGSDIAPTKAKPDIWQDAAGFKSKSDDLQNTAGKLVAASKSGDLAAFKAAFSNMSQSCKACHDGYRNR